MQRCPEIEELARRFVDAKRRGDGESVVAMLARQPDISWIGTEGEDWVTGYDAVAAIHAATPAGIQILPSEPVGYRHGDVAWVTDRMRVAFPDEEVGEIRFTAVAILEEGEWRFVQGQVSVPETQ